MKSYIILSNGIVTLGPISLAIEYQRGIQKAQKGETYKGNKNKKKRKGGKRLGVQGRFSFPFSQYFYRFVSLLGISSSTPLHFLHHNILCKPLINPHISITIGRNLPTQPRASLSSTPSTNHLYIIYNRPTTLFGLIIVDPTSPLRSALITINQTPHIWTTVDGENNLTPHILCHPSTSLQHHHQSRPPSASNTTAKHPIPTPYSIRWTHGYVLSIITGPLLAQPSHNHLSLSLPCFQSTTTTTSPWNRLCGQVSSSKHPFLRRQHPFIR